jgi:hypothetical protein
LCFPDSASPVLEKKRPSFLGRLATERRIAAQSLVNLTSMMIACALLEDHIGQSRILGLIGDRPVDRSPFNSIASLIDRTTSQ